MTEPLPTPKPPTQEEYVAALLSTVDGSLDVLES